VVGVLRVVRKHRRGTLGRQFWPIFITKHAIRDRGRNQQNGPWEMKQVSQGHRPRKQLLPARIKKICARTRNVQRR